MAAQLLKKAVLPLAKILTTHNKDLKEKTEQQALRIQDLENQLQYQSTTQQERPHVTLLGDSNCRDIHPHLMRWLSQDVKNGRIRLSVSTASRTYELSEETHVTWRTDFIRLGSVATNRKNGLTGEQLAVGTDSWSVITGPSRMFSLFTEGCHVAYSRESVGMVCCTYGQSNTTNVWAPTLEEARKWTDVNAHSLEGTTVILLAG